MLSKKEAVGVTAVSKASAVGLSLIVTIWEQKVINAGKVFAEAVGNAELHAHVVRRQVAPLARGAHQAPNNLMQLHGVGVHSTMELQTSQPNRGFPLPPFPTACSSHHASYNWRLPRRIRR